MKRKLTLSAVAQPGRPALLGYRRNGAPIFAVAGADPATLEQERQDVLAQLDRASTDDSIDVDALVERATDLEGRITAHNAAVQRATEARAALLGASVVERAGGTGAPAAVPPVPDGTARGGDGAVTPATVSAADQLLRSQALGSYRAGGGNGKMHALIEGDVRALFATTDNVLQPPRVPGMVAPPDQPLTILDLIDRQTTTGNTVEWVQEVAAPNAAAEVAEGSAKPEASFDLELKTDTTRTIAHWVNITRQALDDDGQLRGYVEGRLRFGLLKRLQAQVLAGNGTAPNLRGILNTSGLGTYTAATATEAAVVSIRKAKTVAQLSQYEPDAFVVNPVDAEALDLSTDTTGQWRVVANPTGTGPTRLWGMAQLTHTAITGTVFGTTGGKFLLGGFREGATLWERTGVDIFITDSHASNFTSNILTLLAELRAALSVWRPLAFVNGTFGASRT